MVYKNGDAARRFTHAQKRAFNYCLCSTNNVCFLVTMTTERNS